MNLPRISACLLLCFLMAPILGECKEIQVSISYMTFSPSSIYAHVGDRISWINKSGIIHELYFPVNPTDSGSPHLRRVLNGSKPRSVVVIKPGDYDFYCRWHGMHGMVHVVR